MINKTKHSFMHLAGNIALYSAVNLLCKSLNEKTINEDVIRELINNDKNFVLAFWHSTMMYPWFKHRGESILGITSKSPDGDLLAKILRKWDYNVVRGSSSKGGKIALGILIDYVKHEGSVAITPDGPRGPKEEMKAGAVITAKDGEVPLLLVGCGYKSKKYLNSWDRFEVPMPFTTVQLIYSDPIYLSATLTREETSEVILECGKKLRELQRRAEIF